MQGSGTEADKAAESEVLAAFLTARNAGRPQVDCYLAGIAAWRRHYPDQQASYAAHQAVALILARQVYRNGFDGL